MGSKPRQVVFELLSFWGPGQDTGQNESFILSVLLLSWVRLRTFGAVRQMEGLSEK